MREDLQKLLDETSVTATDTFDFGSMIPIDIPRYDYEIKANAMRVLGTSKIARLLHVRSWSLEKLKTLGENAVLLIIDVEKNDPEKIKTLLQEKLTSLLVVLWNCPAKLANSFGPILQAKHYFALCSESSGMKDDVDYGRSIESPYLSFNRKEQANLIIDWLSANYPQSTRDQQKLVCELSGDILEIAGCCMQSILTVGTPIFQINKEDKLFWNEPSYTPPLVGYVFRAEISYEKKYFDLFLVLSLFSLTPTNSDKFYETFNENVALNIVDFFEKRHLVKNLWSGRRDENFPKVSFCSLSLGMSLACHWWKNQNVTDIADFILALSEEKNPDLWKQFLTCFEFYGQYVKEALHALFHEANKRASLILKNQVRELIYAANPLEAKRLEQMAEVVQNHRTASLDLSFTFRSMVPPPGYAISQAPFCMHHSISSAAKHGLGHTEEPRAKRTLFDV